MSEVNYKKSFTNKVVESNFRDVHGNNFVKHNAKLSVLSSYERCCKIDYNSVNTLHKYYNCHGVTLNRHR